MAEIDKSSGIILIKNWLIKTLFKFMKSGIKGNSKIGHYFSNNLKRS